MPRKESLTSLVILTFLLLRDLNMERRGNLLFLTEHVFGKIYALDVRVSNNRTTTDEV